MPGSSRGIAEGDPYAKTSMLPSGKQCSLLCDAGLGAQVRTKNIICDKDHDQNISKPDDDEDVASIMTSTRDSWLMMAIDDD